MKRIAFLFLAAGVLACGSETDRDSGSPSAAVRESRFERATKAQIYHINQLMDDIQISGDGYTVLVERTSQSDEELAAEMPGRTWRGYLLALPLGTGEVGVWFHIGSGGKWDPGATLAVNDAAAETCICGSADHFLGVDGQRGTLNNDPAVSDLIAAVTSAESEEPEDSPEPSATVQAPIEGALQTSSAMGVLGVPLPEGANLTKEEHYSDGSGTQQVYQMEATGQEIITFFEGAMQGGGWSTIPPKRAKGGNMTRTFYSDDGSQQLFLATDKDGGIFTLIGS